MNNRIQVDNDNKNRKLVINKLDENTIAVEDIDEIEFNMLSHNNIKNTLLLTFVNNDNKLSLTYDYTDSVSLSEWLRSEALTYDDFYHLFIEICNAFKQTKSNMLQADKYSLDENHIYVGSNLHEVKLMYIPLNDEVFEEDFETRFKRLIFNTIKKTDNIKNDAFLKISQFLKHPNFSVNNFMNLLMDNSVHVSNDTDDFGNTSISKKRNMKYTTKEVKEMPVPSKKEKLYASLITALLLAIIWSQLPLHTDVLLGLAFLLSVLVLACLYVYWKKWRPNTEPVIVKKKVKVKEKKKQHETFENEEETHFDKVNKIKAMDFDTFLKFNDSPSIENNGKDETEQIADTSAMNELESLEIKEPVQLKKEDDYSISYAEDSEIESFVITDQTTLLDDEDIKHNVKIHETDSRFQLTALDESFSDNKVIAVFGDSFKIGRERDESNYIIKDKNVSKNHLEFLKTDDAYSIRDNGSVNGSSLNFEKLMPFKKYPIKTGDNLSIGELNFEYTVKDN